MARAKSRRKKKDAIVVAKPETKKKRKPQRRARTRGNKGQIRVLTHPETGDKISLMPFDEYPEVFRYMAKLLYITGRAGPTAISKQLNIPLSTLRNWQSRDRWTFLKREVIRVANKDLIRSSRRAMSRYMSDIDRALNKMLRVLDTRLDSVVAEDQLKDEGAIFKHMGDLLRLKLQLFRSLTYGVHGQAFQPLPGTLTFDGTEDPKHGNLISHGALDDIRKAIPGHLQEAAKFVTAMDMEDMDPAMLEAVTKKLDDMEKQNRKDIAGEDDSWMDEEDDEQFNNEEEE